MVLAGIMKQISASILIVLLCASLGNAQTILKKKALKKRIEYIKIEIGLKNFESAMEMFYSTNDLVSEEYVTKSDLEQYHTIKNVLDEKQSLFKKNDDKVKTYQKLYNDNDPCGASFLLDLDLSPENAFVSTIEMQKSLLKPLSSARNQCNTHRSQLPIWQSAFDAKKYEAAYEVYSISSMDKTFFYKDDLEALEIIQANLTAKHSNYRLIKDRIYHKPNSTLKSINYQTMNREDAELYLLDLSYALSFANLELRKLEGDNPVLIGLWHQLKPEITETTIKLKAFLDNRSAAN